eukprot:CAMPEP_0178423118 /NCGR_PEP_ID=MMETSP0689_2-20121128/27525_1 /TAXON_ID=160604 /ORGANISM="Amphidinium massartii, Strain CS-259" /LENGTH=177 /DNA_ID=CAMNT_0020044705 /DNA_START=14 /DNA_END=543 /DNA_ORIENTATION=+
MSLLILLICMTSRVLGDRPKDSANLPRAVEESRAALEEEVQEMQTVLGAAVAEAHEEGHERQALHASSLKEVKAHDAKLDEASALDRDVAFDAVASQKSSSLGYTGLHKTEEKLEEMSRAWDEHVRGAFTETAKTALNVSETYHETLKHLEGNLENFDKGAREFQHRTYEVHDARVA